MQRNIQTLMVGALVLIVACDAQEIDRVSLRDGGTETGAGSDTGESGGALPDDPCEKLTPEAFDDAIGALDAAAAMAQAHLDAHPIEVYEGAGAAARDKFLAASTMLATQRDYIVDHNFFDPHVTNPTITSGDGCSMLCRTE